MKKSLARHTSTGHDSALHPRRQMSDACRRHRDGPLLPMEQPSFWRRLFRK